MQVLRHLVVLHPLEKRMHQLIGLITLVLNLLLSGSGIRAKLWVELRRWIVLGLNALLLELERRGRPLAWIKV